MAFRPFWTLINCSVLRRKGRFSSRFWFPFREFFAHLTDGPEHSRDGRSSALIKFGFVEVVEPPTAPHEAALEELVEATERRSPRNLQKTGHLRGRHRPVLQVSYEDTHSDEEEFESCAQRFAGIGVSALQALCNLNESARYQEPFPPHRELPVRHGVCPIR